MAAVPSGPSLDSIPPPLYANLQRLLIKKNCPSAGCASVSNVVCLDADVF
jgi:hypothetical protein